MNPARRCFVTRRSTEGLLRRNYHDKLPHQIPASAAAQDVIRFFYKKAKRRLAAESDAAAGSAADAAADEAEDADDDDDEAGDAEQDLAAAQGQVALQAASEAALAGVTGDTRPEHIHQLVAQLPGSQEAAEEAASAASGRHQQNDIKWADRNEQLARMLADAAAGRKPQCRRGDDRHQQLLAEVQQLKDLVSRVRNETWSSRSWEVRRGAVLGALYHCLSSSLCCMLSPCEAVPSGWWHMWAALALTVSVEQCVTTHARCWHSYSVTVRALSTSTRAPQWGLHACMSLYSHLCPMHALLSPFIHVSVPGLCCR